MINRRGLLAGTAMAVGGFAVGRSFGAESAVPLSPGVPEGVVASATLEALPGKRPLIKLSYRPPNYETPVSYFREAITPNDAFFVRYHLADIPQVDAAKWSLKIGGGANPLTLTLDDLKRDYPPVEIVAVCQCSGNRRGLSSPHVAGVEWGYGAMGNARWKGARLRDILARAGAPKQAVEIVYRGADGPVSPGTPAFVKSLPLWKAMDENTILAYEMNGAPLPHWNGFPVRLIVPGWTATYWMKHLTAIDFAEKPFDGFWMKAAYRVPLGLFPSIDRFSSQDSATNTPITDIMVNSLLVSPANGASVRAGEALTIDGIAWDSGRGISDVEVSTDGGESWRPARLGEDLGRYSFRPFSYVVPSPRRGRLSLIARASNKAGQTQPDAALFNPAGYHHNVAARLELDVV
jgi:DMSO/TMAO reductase YedYZ molybdopterin-dependent catalytic subunit